MTEPPTETLAIVSDAVDYDAAVERLREVATVTQLLPPRLALVVPAGSVVPEVPGVSFHERDVPASVFDELTDIERMFVAAWTSRHAPKQRPGDRLPWDAPGRQPPR